MKVIRDAEEEPPNPDNIDEDGDTREPVELDHGGDGGDDLVRPPLGPLTRLPDDALRAVYTDMKNTSAARRAELLLALDRARAVADRPLLRRQLSLVVAADDVVFVSWTAPPVDGKEGS